MSRREDSSVVLSRASKPLSDSQVILILKKEELSIVNFRLFRISRDVEHLRRRMKMKYLVHH